MENKSKYRELCKNETSIPIFSQDWWMDAVCGKDNWNVIIVEKGNQITAAMPYYFKKRNGYIYTDQPKLTQKNGVWIKYPNNQKYVTKLSYEKEVINKIIKELEELKIGAYSQNFDYSFTNWLPFYWNSFRQTTRYTYVIENLKNMEQIYSDFNSNTRREIKRAQKVVKVKEDLKIEEFYRINKKTFERQNIRIPYSLDFVKRLDLACLKHRCRKIFYAEDKEGRIHAVNYIVWDKNSAYGLMSGGEPKLRNSQANILLIWNAIQFSSEVTKKFDFEGSMIESIEKLFRSFGAIQKPYFNISKNYRGIMYSILKDIYKKISKI